MASLRKGGIRGGGGGGGAEVPAAYSYKTINDIEKKFDWVAENHEVIDLRVV